MFTGLTPSICKEAWNVARASAVFAAAAGITNHEAGTIVVLNPADGTVLFQERLAVGGPNPERYDTNALAKAQLCWKTGLPSRVVQQSAPHLYRPGMTKWGGGVVENGLVVAFSGVQAVFDEAIAWSVLAWIVAMCQDEMTKPGGVMDEESSFIGGMSPDEIAMAFDAAGAEAERRMAGH